jgi:hypothetical protein
VTTSANSDVSGEAIKALIPEAVTVLRALEKTPGACTEGEKNAVEFFYKKAMVCVDANITSKDIWIANNTYRKILKKDWYFVFATGLTLLAKYSSIANILENVKRKDTSDTDSSKDSKRTRARLHSKAEKAEVRDVYFHYCSLFRTMGGKEGVEQRMKQWDDLYSPAAARTAQKGAKDRRSIAPTEHQAEPNDGAPTDLDNFMKSSPDFDFLDNTRTNVWDEATSNMQLDRQAAVNTQTASEL